jgi:hypothetical protein
MVMKQQMDFQQKIEHHMLTLQSMMQTLCQLVNNELIPMKKAEGNGSSRCIFMRMCSASVTSSALDRASSSRDLLRTDTNDLWSNQVPQCTGIRPTNSASFDELTTMAQRIKHGEISFLLRFTATCAQRVDEPINADHEVICSVRLIKKRRSWSRMFLCSI